MNPLQLQNQLNITPDIVLSRTSNLNELEIPKSNVQFVCASSDLNVSKWICTVVMVFMRDGTSTIIWHKFKKCRISASLPPEDYKKKLYDALSEHGKEPNSLGIPI